MSAVPSINSNLVISGLLRAARDTDDPRKWLSDRHKAALDAVMAGDEFVTSSSTEGGGSSAERGMPASMLLQLYEAALQIFDAEESATQAGVSAPGTVRWADFSNFPSTLG